MTERMTDTPRRTYYFTRGRDSGALSLSGAEIQDDLDGKLKISSENESSTTTQTVNLDAN